MEILFKFIDWLWGIPMLIILGTWGIYLTIGLKFLQFRKLPFILRHTIFKSFKEKKDDNKISGFQAVTAALASTLGTGNIVGVAFAIAFGGPGAIFWMWFVGLIACAIKYSETAIALKYREINDEGFYVGGPMYYLSKGTNIKCLGSIFAVAAIVVLAIAAAVQVGSVAETLEMMRVPLNLSVLIVVGIVGIIVYGGITRIVKVTEFMIPIMSIIYIIGGGIVIILNIHSLPEVFLSIFKGAFTSTSAVGGFSGSAIALTIRWGISRGVYSSDAGNGLSSISHSNAEVNHPIEQAMWGVFEVFFDTIIVCSFTALTILCTGVWKIIPGEKAATMTISAYQEALGHNIGGGIVSISLFLFALSTIIVFVYFGEKQAERLFGTKAAKVTKFIYLLILACGGIYGVNKLIRILDLGIAVIMIINIFGLVLMRKEIFELTEDYFSNLSEDEKYIGDIEKRGFIIKK